jgi:hypothetical protein
MDFVGEQQEKLNNQLMCFCPQNEKHVLGGNQKS